MLQLLLWLLMLSAWCQVLFFAAPFLLRHRCQQDKLSFFFLTLLLCLELR
jgi:hypothetical protein